MYKNWSLRRFLWIDSTGKIPRDASVLGMSIEHRRVTKFGNLCHQVKKIMVTKFAKPGHPRRYRRRCGELVKVLPNEGADREFILFHFGGPCE